MNLFLQIMIFFGIGMLTISTNGVNSQELAPQSDDSMVVKMYHPVSGSRLTKVSKRKLGISIASRVDIVIRAYDFVSAKKITDFGGDILTFTVETDSGVFPNVQCHLSFLKVSLQGSNVAVMLLQNCQNDEVVFSDTNLALPLLEVIDF